jgi:hypothetical protein
MPCRRDRFTHEFEDLLVERTNLPPIRLHDLRHGAASLSLAAGNDLKSVQEMLGHASMSFTADYYVSLYPGTRHQAAEKISASLFAAPPSRTHRTRLPLHCRRVAGGAESAVTCRQLPQNLTLGRQIRRFAAFAEHQMSALSWRNMVYAGYRRVLRDSDASPFVMPCRTAPAPPATPTDTPRPTNTDAEPHPEGTDRPSPQRRFPRSSNKNDRRRQIERPVPTCTHRSTRSPEPTATDTQRATQIHLTCRKITKSNVSTGQKHDRSGPPGARTQNLRIKSLREMNVGECR